MGWVSVLVAAAAAWVFGALWYMVLSRQWLAAAGMREPGRSALPFVLSFVLMVVVAGMMRHTLATTGIVTLGGGVVGGLGLGLFIATPWIAINNLYQGKPPMLTAIDGGFATIGCAIMGGALTLL